MTVFGACIQNTEPERGVTVTAYNYQHQALASGTTDWDQGIGTAGSLLKDVRSTLIASQEPNVPICGWMWIRLSRSARSMYRARSSKRDQRGLSSMVWGARRMASG